MIYDGVSAEEFRELLLERGYRALIDTESSGSQKVFSAASGLKFVMYFYEAEKPEDRATSVGFICTLTHSETREQALDLANTWNKRMRFAALSVNDDDDFVFSWDVAVKGGVSDENLRLAIDRWAGQLGELMNHLNSR